MKILIKDILPNESFYSYLSRLYVHSGIANHIEFRKMVFKRSNEYLSIIYGDYMQLPPIEQQKTHHCFRAYIKEI